MRSPILQHETTSPPKNLTQIWVINSFALISLGAELATPIPRWKTPAQQKSQLCVSVVSTLKSKTWPTIHIPLMIYVSESKMGFWKAVLSGPAESAYASGTFILYLDIGDDYPQSPPQACFITRIFHPNINLGGRCCHSIFDRNYTVDITNKQVLDTVFGLLLVPELTDSINTVVTLNFYWDEVAFREEVKKHIEKYALKGREELGKEILGE
jgi:ubiquitin-protein ligase